jgi:hypothetical protein
MLQLTTNLTRVLVTIGGTSIVAQENRPKSEAEIRTLIAKSRSKDLKTSDEARDALSKLDVKSLPALTSILRKGKACERIAVAQWFIEMNPTTRIWFRQ